MRHRCRRGSAILEAGLAIPVLALLGLGLTDAARLFHARQAAAGAARAAAQLVINDPGAGAEQVVRAAWANLPGAIVTVSAEIGCRRIRVEAVAPSMLHLMPGDVRADVVVPVP